MIKKNKLNKIPNIIKYLICGISTLIFLLFTFEKINPFEFNDILQNITGCFFTLSFNSLDHLVISLIPFFGMLLNSRRKKFKINDLIKDLLIIILFVIIIIGIGLYLLTFIGKSDNPLIPKSFISEPFFLYSTLTVLTGIIFPFLVIHRNKKQNEINSIGTE